MKQLDTTLLRKNVTLSIVLAILLLIIIVAETTTLVQKYRQDQRIQEYDTLLHQNIEFIVKRHLQNYTNRIQRLTRTTELPGLLKKRDREGLYRLLKPKWDLMLKEGHGLAIMHVHLPDGSSFLRMHQPEHFGDQLAHLRSMIKVAHHSHRFISGYETGKYGTGYRIIAPIFDAEQRYIGSFEIGLNPNFVLHVIHGINSFSGLMFAKESGLNLLDRSDDLRSIGGYQLQSELTPELEAIYRALTPLNLLEDNAKITVGNKRYITHLFTFNDFQGQPKVKFLIFQNIPEVSLLQDDLLVWLLISMVIILSLLTWFVYRRIGTYQHDVAEVYYKQIKQLDKSEKHLQFSQNYLQSIFDSTPNIMITTNGDMIENATPTMLEFFGYETVEAFKSEHDCICDFFLEEDECLQSVMDGVTWLEYMNTHPSDTHKACMMHNGKRHRFIVQAKAMGIDEKQRSVVTFIDITELEEVRERLEYAVNGTNDGLWDWDIKSGTVYLSPRWKAMLGYKDDELPNLLKSWEDRVHPDDIEKALHDIDMSHRSPGIPFENIYRLRHKEGYWVWILGRGQTIFDENGKAVRMVGFQTNITKLKNLENELRASKQQFDLFMLHMPYFVNIKDESYRSVYANPAKDKFLNRLAVGTTAVENAGEKVGQQINALCDRAKVEGKADELIRYEQNGQSYILRALAFAIPQNDGKVYVGIIYIDITKQYKDQHEIAKFKQLLEKSPVSIVITDIDGNIEYVNPWFSQVTGYSPEEAIGQNPRILKSDCHPASDYVKLWDEVTHGNVWSGIFRNLKKNGEEYWESAIIAPIKNEEGNIVNYIGIKQEITEKVRLKEELVKQEAKTHELGSILEESVNEIYIFDRNSLKFLYANKGAQKNIGYSLEELFEMTPLDIKPAMTKKKFLEHIMPLNRDDVLKIFFSTQHKRKDGTIYPVDVYIQEIVFEGINAYMAIIIDTTEREEMRKEMRNQEEVMIAQSRHAAMGEMIGMIAHQWRQPITVIAMGANNMLVDIELDELSVEACKEQTQSILKQTDYLSKTIDDFRNFFRPNKEKEVVKLEEVVAEAEKIIGKTLEHANITLSIRNKNGYKVKTYSRELLQVFINLLKNANEALVEHRETDRHIDVMISDGADNVITTVCDNAGGIDEAIIDKIFDPYFSTKDKNIGTGLGLYMSKTIVEKHLHGTIEVSNTKEGACFKIAIPLGG